MKPKSLPLRLFDRNPSPESGEGPGEGPAKYQRHVDRPERLDEAGCGDGSGQDEKSNREIHFGFLAEKYEPLVDEEAKVKAKEEKKRRKKESYKKVKKNVGKALRTTWKCLMLGLYNFALGYSTPVTVAATFVPDFLPGRTRP